MSAGSRSSCRPRRALLPRDRVRPLDPPSYGTGWDDAAAVAEWARGALGCSGWLTRHLLDGSKLRVATTPLPFVHPSGCKTGTFESGKFYTDGSISPMKGLGRYTNIVQKSASSANRQYSSLIGPHRATRMLEINGFASINFRNFKNPCCQESEMK